MDENTLERYLDVAYEEADGNPEEVVDPRQVGQKTGFDDEQDRRAQRELVNKGLLVQEGQGYRLSLPAIHSVEQVRLEKGKETIVDERREQRGTYVRELYDAADGDPTTDVPLDQLKDRLGYAADVERRTRGYLVEAGLVAQPGSSTVRVTEDGAAWVEGA